MLIHYGTHWERAEIEDDMTNRELANTDKIYKERMANVEKIHIHCANAIIGTYQDEPCSFAGLFNTQSGSPASVRRRKCP